MREYEINFSEGLKNGLRPEKAVARNSKSLVEARNVKIGPVGLQAKPEFIQPLDVSVDWPFPELRKLSLDWLMLEKGKVSKVDPSDWSYSEVLDPLSGLSWHYADFQDYVVLTNGSLVYERDPSTGNYSQTSELPIFKTCCNFRGQLIAGNISSNFYDCDATSVIWSKIGSAQVELDWSNQAGYAPAGVGEIFKVVPMSEGILVCGADGISGFIPASRPVPTFGKREVAEFGIASRDAVGGNENQQVVLDDSGCLWAISGNFEKKRLGYEEFLSPMIGNDIKISYNPSPGEFFISDGERCFVLYEGLSEISEIPTSLNWHDGQLVGIFSESNDPGIEISTSPLDFGWRGIKRLETLEFSLDSSSLVEASVDWRNSLRDDWRTSKWIRINQFGTAYIGIRASEFKVKLRTSSPAELNLDNIKIRLKIDDHRFARGGGNVD